MDELAPCPKCQCVNTYEMGALLVCPECAHEWIPQEEVQDAVVDDVIRDAVGNILQDGDTVTREPLIGNLKPAGGTLAPIP